MQQLFDSLSPALFFIAFLLFDVVIIVIVFVARNRSLQTLREDWQQLAMRTGLSYTPGNFVTMPTLGGEYRRRTLSLSTFTRSTGKSSTTYTRVALGLKTAPAGTLALSPEGFLSGLGKALGMQDVQIGSEGFDKSFMVKSNPPEFAQSVLNDPTLQDALIRLREGHSFQLELGSQGLTYTEIGLLRDGDFLAGLFNTLSDLADKLDGGSKSSMFS